MREDQHRLGRGRGDIADIAGTGAIGRIKSLGDIGEVNEQIVEALGEIHHRTTALTEQRRRYLIRAAHHQAVEDRMISRPEGDKGQDQHHSHDARAHHHDCQPRSPGQQAVSDQADIDDQHRLEHEAESATVTKQTVIARFHRRIDVAVHGIERPRHRGFADQGNGGAITDLHHARPFFWGVASSGHGVPVRCGHQASGASPYWARRSSR